MKLNKKRAGVEPFKKRIDFHFKGAECQPKIDHIEPLCTYDNCVPDGSVTRWLDCLFNIWTCTCMIMCQIVLKIAKVCSKFCQILSKHKLGAMLNRALLNWTENLSSKDSRTTLFWCFSILKYFLMYFWKGFILRCSQGGQQYSKTVIPPNSSLQNFGITAIWHLKRIWGRVVNFALVH